MMRAMLCVFISLLDIFVLHAENNAASSSVLTWIITDANETEHCYWHFLICAGARTSGLVYVREGCFVPI